MNALIKYKQMKLNYIKMKYYNTYIIILLSAIFALSSCELEMAKKVPTLPEVELFNYCETNTFNTLDILDNAIGLSLYLEAPDSMKNITMLNVLKNKSVIKTQPLTYKLITYNNKYHNIDTILTVKIDSSSIFKKGAKWEIKFGSYYLASSPYSKTSFITCLDSTKWSFKTNRSKLSDFVTTGELIITSSAKKPLFFSKVTVTGDNEFNDLDTTNTGCKANVSITNALVKESLKWKFNAGNFTCHWNNLKTKSVIDIQAEYTPENKWIISGPNKTYLINLNLPNYYLPTN
jgi:hypothetical protein